MLEQPTIFILLTMYFLIGLGWGYAIFHKPAENKFFINLKMVKKERPATKRPVTSGVASLPALPVQGNV